MTGLKAAFSTDHSFKPEKRVKSRDFPPLSPYPPIPLSPSSLFQVSRFKWAAERLPVL
jgi:hypothetical protein